MLSRGVRFAAFVFAAFICTTPVQSAPQSAPSPPATTLRVEVRQVLVPVVVTDRKGHYVPDLKADDFEVFENNAPQKIVSFGTETENAPNLNAPAPATSSGTAVAPAVSSEPPVLQSYVILLDTLNSSFGNFAVVRGALRKLFKNEDSATSQYALLALGRQPLILQNITRDPDAIIRALGSKELTRSITDSEASNLSVQETQLSEMLSEYCNRCPCAGAASATSRTSGGSDQVCADKRASLEMWVGAEAQQRALEMRGFWEDIYNVVGQLEKLPGKRHLILISDGFSRQPGLDLFRILGVYFQDPAETQKPAIDDLEPLLQQVLQLATAHNVAVYTLDSRQLYGPAGGTYDASNSVRLTREQVILPQLTMEKETGASERQDMMAELAAETGGLFYRNSNDLLKGMKRAFADGREYYLLAYNPTNTALDGTFRQIRVEVRGKGLVVRAKRGYWAPTK